MSTKDCILFTIYCKVCFHESKLCNLERLAIKLESKVFILALVGNIELNICNLVIILSPSVISG